MSKPGTSKLYLKGDRGPYYGSVEIYNEDTGGPLATAKADSRGKFRLLEVLPTPPCRVRLEVGEYVFGPVAVKKAAGCGSE